MVQETSPPGPQLLLARRTVGGRCGREVPPRRAANRDPTAMALTDTALQLTEANRALACWDLQVAENQVAPGSGTANASVILRTPCGRLLLKRRNPRYSNQQWVCFDHALMEHLHARALPTPLAIPTTQGRRWARVDDTVYELYPFMEGEEHSAGHVGQIMNAGEMLARFQEATASFDPPSDKQWERYHSPAKIAEGLDKLSVTRPISLNEMEALTFASRTARELLERVPDDAYWALPQTIVHGDYHPANLKFRGDRVAGVFDLDWCTRQPRMVDLADGLLFFCGRRAQPVIPGDIWSLTQGFEMDADLVLCFGSAYASVVTPRERELRALPDLMRCRWLYCRVDAMQRKVAPARQLEFLVRDLLPPLRWLDRFETRIADGTLLGLRPAR